MCDFWISPFSDRTCQMEQLLIIFEVWKRAHGRHSERGGPFKTNPWRLVEKLSACHIPVKIFTASGASGYQLEVSYWCERLHRTRLAASWRAVMQCWTKQSQSWVKLNNVVHQGNFLMLFFVLLLLAIIYKLTVAPSSLLLGLLLGFFSFRAACNGCLPLLPQLNGRWLLGL